MQFQLDAAYGKDRSAVTLVSGPVAVELAAGDDDVAGLVVSEPVPDSLAVPLDVTDAEVGLVADSLAEVVEPVVVPVPPPSEEELHAAKVSSAIALTPASNRRDRFRATEGRDFLSRADNSAPRG